MPAISVQNLSKAYKQYPSRWARLAEWLIPGTCKHQLKWILQDINFTVQPGEALGIIGMNGAGKSTLLKLITGTTHPTTGTVQMHGRVAALLELGMGFHPDFTGRQNAYMSGQLLGYSTEEVSRLMPEIEAFAEIGEYIDQPVRVYSSGMQVRLAFSVATAIRPDILIVDEALSVGDAYFVHKSFSRIRHFREKGTTLLIVSHDKGTVQAICDRAILLSKGIVSKQGAPEAVFDFYNALLSNINSEKVQQKVSTTGKIETISGSGDAKIQHVTLLNAKKIPIETARVGEKVTLQVKIKALNTIPELVLGYMIKDRLGQEMFGTNTYHYNKTLYNLKQGDCHTFSFSFLNNLGEGAYSISVALHATAVHVSTTFEWRDLAYVFHVINDGKTHFIGSTWIPPTIEIENE